MFSKILLTLLVIGGAVLFLRARKGPPAAPAYRPPVSERSPYAYEAIPASRFRPWHWAAIFLTLATLAGAGWYLYHYWTDAHRQVSITVVNSNTGESKTYQAYKGEIQREEGTFRTVDGRVVSLSSVDRMEIGSR